MKTDDIMRGDDANEVRIVGLVPENTIDVIDIPRNNTPNPVHQKEDGLGKKKKKKRGEKERKNRMKIRQELRLASGGSLVKA